VALAAPEKVLGAETEAPELESLPEGEAKRVQSEAVEPLLFATVMLRLLDAVWAVASVTWTVKGKEPAEVGVPEMLPEELSARPLGREPLPSDQLYGVVPPAAVSVALKAADTVAPGSCVVVICRVGEAALTVRVAALLVTLPLALLTTTVKREPLSEAVVAGVV